MEFECPICIEKKSIDYYAITLDCNCKFCSECLSENILTLIN